MEINEKGMVPMLCAQYCVNGSRFYGFTEGTVISGLGHRMPSDKLNIVGVGVGGRGGG